MVFSGRARIGRLAPFDDLGGMRRYMARAFAVLLWLHVPVVALIAFSNRMPVVPIGGVMALAAGIGTLATALWGGDLRARCTLAAALTVAPMLMVYAGTGPWQTDYHMYFFVIFGMLVAFVDWRPIMLSAALTGAHHVVLAALFPDAVFEHSDFGRVVLHVAIVIADTIVLFAIVRQMKALHDRSQRSLAIAEGALEEARLLESVVVNVNEAVIISETDYTPGVPLVFADRRVLYVNAAFTKITGFERNDFRHKSLNVLYGGGGDSTQVAAAFEAAAAGTSGTFSDVWYASDKRAIDVEASLVSVDSGEAGVVRAIVLIRDVTASRRAAEASLRAELAEQTNAALKIEICERENAEKRLVFAAHHDELTGLPNRASFRERLGEALAGCDDGQRRHDPVPEPAVMFIDLDRFKLVNDGLGHGVGDLLLVAVAERLRGCLRDEDMLARLGGDEFTVLISRPVSTLELESIGERLLASFASPFEISGLEMYVAASIGIAHGRTSPSDEADDLLRNADLAMYKAKSLGRGRQELFVPSLLEKSARLLQLDTHLRRALERSEITTYFQPIVELATERVCGFEALVRWRHPIVGIIPPDEFIAMAEESGLILELGQFVLEASCRQVRRCLDELPQSGDVWMSVNVSPKQLREAGYLRGVLATLALYAIPPALLHLEVTESTIVSDLHAIAPLLRQLRAAGISISIDDFGTGFSSLQYLDKLPIDTLKIDRSFVSGRGEGIANLKIVRTIVKLAQELNLEIISEGVETTSQADMLFALTHAYGQGYLYSRPLDADGAFAFLAAQDFSRQLAETHESNDLQARTAL